MTENKVTTEKNIPQPQQPTFEQVLPNVHEALLQVSTFVSTAGKNIGILSNEVVRLQSVEKEVVKLKAEIIDHKGTIRILKKGIKQPVKKEKK